MIVVLFCTTGLTYLSKWRMVEISHLLTTWDHLSSDPKAIHSGARTVNNISTPKSNTQPSRSLPVIILKAERKFFWLKHILPAISKPEITPKKPACSPHRRITVYISMAQLKPKKP